MTNSEIIMIALTAVIAAPGVVGACIFNNQLSVMQGQLDEMKSTGTQTDKLIEQNTKLADAATVSARTAARQYETAFKPWLVAKISGPYIDEKIYPLNRIKEGEGPRWIEINVAVENENIGDMPATIVRSSLAALGVMGPTPDEGDVFEILTKSGRYYPRRDPIPKDFENRDELKYVTVAGFMLNREIREQIFRAAPPIVGKIQYLDPLGKRRELGYAFAPRRVWNPSGFSRWGGPEYNYDREIKE